jgi:cytochrome c-type biogenesis protein CcmH/NrfF
MQYQIFLRDNEVGFVMKKSIPFLLVLLLMPFGWAFDSELETEAKAIEGLLISPCCWRQPVSVHFSPASDEVREEVREMLSAGLTREEIFWGLERRLQL